ncbi:MAG: translation initiation factor IF-5A [Nanoarchaeota archaeon]|nr:translation initiation factor IF-5A [Nanoarchaeota archaeon]MBU1703892.1 translation initiation factor IF-5A [Nanoarchaeota archaeon]
MGETKPVSIGTLQKGSFVVVDGAACKVTDTQTSRPGKHGHAKVRMEAVGLIDNKKRIIVAPGHDNIYVPIIGKKVAQVLSVANNVANVMDAETFETFDLPVPEELQGQVVEGCNVVYWLILDDKVMKQVKTE